jgi:putative transposase
MTENTLSPLNNVITIDDERIKSHLDRVVRGTVEETLNALLDVGADRLCNAQRYERSEARGDTRAGHYQRKLQTRAWRGQAADTEASGADVRDGDYRALPAARELGRAGLDRDVFGGVSVRRVEDITEALRGTRVSPSTVSELNKKVYGTIEAWRNRPIEGAHPDVHLDGIVLKRSWAGEVRNVSLRGANGEGYREILGICEGAKEEKAAQASQGTRPQGRPADNLRCLHWAGGKRRRVLSRCRLAKVCRRSPRCSRRSIPARTLWRPGRRLSK